MNRIRRVIIIVCAVIFLGSCYKEYNLDPSAKMDVFNFIMTEEQENQIYSSRGVVVNIENPLPVLYFDNNQHIVDHFKTRGASSLSYRRKSFSVNLDNRLTFIIDSQSVSRDIEKFKLISMVFDYTYIEECIAISIFKRIGLWPVYSDFNHVMINNNSQGLYLFIEDPDDYFLYECNASVSLHRGYNNSVKEYESNSSNSKTDDFYLDRFAKIYTLIVEYSNKQLYDSLTCLMNLNQYFTKIAIDLLLQNGDYTDEVYFYTQNIGDNEIFNPFPWDYDDIFAGLPHEVGRSWAVGRKFGSRVYNSINDVNAVLQGRLLFSIEDDLDYKIAIDDFLYRKYLENMDELFQTIDYNFIEAVFNEAENKIAPFYENDTIIEQSKYDQNETTFQLFQNNLIEKKQFLHERRDWIVQKINYQK